MSSSSQSSSTPSANSMSSSLSLFSPPSVSSTSTLTVSERRGLSKMHILLPHNPYTDVIVPKPQFHSPTAPRGPFFAGPPTIVSQKPRTASSGQTGPLQPHVNNIPRRRRARNPMQAHANACRAAHMHELTPGLFIACTGAPVDGFTHVIALVTGENNEISYTPESPILSHGSTHLCLTLPLNPRDDGITQLNPSQLRAIKSFAVVDSKSRILVTVPNGRVADGVSAALCCLPNERHTDVLTALSEEEDCVWHGALSFDGAEVVLAALEGSS